MIDVAFLQPHVNNRLFAQGTRNIRLAVTSKTF